MQRGGDTAFNLQPSTFNVQRSNAPTRHSPESHFRIARERRKELFDTFTKITSCGYLFRKLAAVASAVVVTEEDCGASGPRNPVRCEAHRGVCAACYGRALPTGQPVSLGTPIGMIALSALGEHAFRLPVESVHRLAGLLEARAPLQIQEREVAPAELLAEGDVEALHTHLLRSLQAVYEAEGFSVDARHFEVFIRQMLAHVRVTDPGDTSFAEGELVQRARLEEANGDVLADGGRPATWEPQVVGITKAALVGESFLSAAAFQQTTDVLAKAALAGASDPLQSLHARVIAGRIRL